MQLTVNSGQLPVSWEVKKLVEVCKVEKYQGIYTNLPYVGMENIESNTARFIGSTEPQSVKSSTFKFRPNHLLYGRLRPYLNKVLAPDFEGHCSTEIFPIKTSECLNRNFLLYWLLMDSTVKRINATCTGARMPRANINDVFEFDFPLPPLSEQKRIVAILDEAFEGIDRAIANTEKNLANSRELFENYLNAIFTQKGDGWVEKKLGEVCTLQRGFDLPKQLRQEGSYSLVSSSGIIDSHTKAKVKGPGVATGRSGSIGNVFYINQDFWPLNTVLYVKDFHGNDVEFVYHLLKQFDLQKYAGGTGVPTLNRNNVHDVKVRIPSLINNQKKIVAELNELKAETQRLEAIYRKKIAALNELKQSILQKAFTGELTADTPKVVKEKIAA